MPLHHPPAIGNEHLTLNRAGQVGLTLKTPYRDGTTHIVMSPLEFMQRLAALVPRPRLHLIRFHGVLAPRTRPPQGAPHFAPVGLGAAIDRETLRLHTYLRIRTTSAPFLSASK